MRVKKLPKRPLKPMKALHLALIRVFFIKNHKTGVMLQNQ